MSIVSGILSASGLVLQFACVLFASIHIWLNIFSRDSDLPSKLTTIWQAIKTTMIMALVFVFLPCLLSYTETIEQQIAYSSYAYSIVSISWLFVILECGIAVLISVISKSAYKATLTNDIQKVFRIALIGTILSMILSWLLS